MTRTSAVGQRDAATRRQRSAAERQRFGTHDGALIGGDDGGVGGTQRALLADSVGRRCVAQRVAVGPEDIESPADAREAEVRAGVADGEVIRDFAIVVLLPCAARAVG